jgi:hypothetical protein
MTIQIKLKGDGIGSSSVAFTTLIFPVSPESLPYPQDNVDLIEGDGGYEDSYEQGTYRMIFPYSLRQVSVADLNALESWWKIVKGRLHWFTLFPHNYPLSQESIQQAYSGGSTTIIQNALLNQGVDFWRGWWAYVFTGAAAGQKRKIISSDGINKVTVSPAFNNIVAVNDYVQLSYFVRLLDDKLPKGSMRSPEYYDINLNMIEKVMD